MEDQTRSDGGYTNLGNFNIKEAIGSLTKTHRMEEGKWRKILCGRWWPKVADFCLLLLRIHILTWGNIQAHGFMGPLRCFLSENNKKTINHLLDECMIAKAIWEKGTGIFKKNHRHKGRRDLTIVEWPKTSFKNKILNRVWDLFLGFTVWENL